jgi:hypothetical protein
MLYQFTARTVHKVIAFIVLAVIAFHGTSASLAARNAEPQSRPNIVFILADDKYECARPDMDKCR